MQQKATKEREKIYFYYIAHINFFTSAEVEQNCGEEEAKKETHAY